MTSEFNQRERPQGKKISGIGEKEKHLLDKMRKTAEMGEICTEKNIGSG